MGSCLSSPISAVDPSQSQASLLDKSKSKPTKTKSSFLQDQDTTKTALETSITDLDATLPLSPLSPGYSGEQGSHSSSASPNDLLTLPTLTISPVSFRLKDDVVLSPRPANIRSAATRHASTSSVVSITSSLSSHSTMPERRKNRAFQARLEKARSVQRALAYPGRDGDDDSHSGVSSESPRFFSPSEAASEESTCEIPGFESTSVWSNISLDSNVTAVAFSKQASGSRTDIQSIERPLLLAIGTDLGHVTLHTWTEAKGSPIMGSAGNVEHSRVSIDKLSRQVRALDLDSTSTYLAAAGDDCTCSIYLLQWKTITSNDENSEDETSLASLLESVELIQKVPRADRVYTVSFGSSYLAVGGFDGNVAILSIQDWSLVTEISREGLIYSVDWSFDGRYLAVAGTDKAVAIVDTQNSWNVWKEIKVGLASTQVVRFRPQSYSLAIGGSSLLVVRDWTIKKTADLGFSDDKCYKIQSLSWSPTGTYMVLVDSKNVCKLLETSGYSVVHELKCLNVLRCVTWGEEYQCSGLPRRYIAAGGDGPSSQVRLIKAGLEFSSSNASILLSDDYSTSESSSSSISSIGQGSFSMPRWTNDEHAFQKSDDILDMSMSRINVDQNETVLAISFSRGSRTRSSTYMAYSLDDGRVIVRSTIGEWKIAAELQFSKKVKKLDFSVGSRFLALGSTESRIWVLETAPSWKIVTTHDFFAPISCIGFSKKNERLAVGVNDGILALFDPQDDFTNVGEIDASDSAVLCLDWSSKNFCIGREDGTLSLYDGPQVCENFCIPYTEHELCSPVRAVSFGPHGRFLAAGAANGLVNVYSHKGSWALCHQLNGPLNLSSMCWNISGRLLALGGDGSAVKMVDTIFWNDVDELNHLLPTTTENEKDSFSRKTPSCMSFGQDGVAFAFVGPDRDGLRVVDTKEWTILFSHRGDPVEAEAAAVEL